MIIEEFHSLTMDVSSNEEEESGWSQKMLQTCEVNEDFISKLPDHIRVHILSFLPLRDAIKTALLQSFGKLWISMPVLDLDNCSHDYENYDYEEDCDYEKFMDIIHQVWNYQDAIALDKLHLKFSFALTYSKNESVFDPDNDSPEFVAYEIQCKEREKTAAEQIEKLVDYAISRKVKDLDLNFMGCSGTVMSLHELYELPDVFRSNYLRDLRLTACNIRSHEEINLPALKVLSLREVSLSNKVMEKILLGCPLLEDLSVIDCYGLRHLNCVNPKLKKVMLCLNIKSNRPLFLSCPHAESLKISGWIERATLVTVSSLVDAEIYFSYLFTCQQRRYDNVCWLMMMLHQCKTFTPCTWTILVLSICNVKNFACPSFKWRNIIITRLGLTKWHLPGLCLLLKRCLCLETLTMEISPGWDFLYKTDDAKWIWEYDFDEENYWDSQEVTFPCLKSIVIYGHINEAYVIQMVKFLLKNAPNLQKLEISAKKTLEGSVDKDLYTSEQLEELSQKLLTLPRASSQAMICFD